MATTPHGPGTEYGIFLPIGSGGWIVSETCPGPEGDYEQNRRCARLAEQYGLDFVMSMGKWRGYGGTTGHWEHTLESLTTTAALAEATERIRLWATVHTNLFHPALTAKMMTTLQQASGGRAGLNIVVGAYAEEFAQMGLWREDLGHTDRYAYTEEWATVLRRLWTEDSVTHEGRFLSLRDCRSLPHPDPLPALIGAGRSEPGLDFQARHCDGSFLTAQDLPGLRAAGRDVRARAAERGRSVRTYSMLTVVMDETDAAAEARRRELGRGADTEAIVNMKASWGLPRDRALSLTARGPEDEAFQTPFVTGSPATVAERVEELVEAAELDGLMLIFPDYDTDLPAFGEQVMPLLRPAAPGGA